MRAARRWERDLAEPHLRAGADLGPLTHLDLVGRRVLAVQVGRGPHHLVQGGLAGTVGLHGGGFRCLGHATGQGGVDQPAHGGRNGEGGDGEDEGDEGTLHDVLLVRRRSIDLGVGLIGQDLNTFFIFRSRPPNHLLKKTGYPS
jgi:hypothetical protein